MLPLNKENLFELCYGAALVGYFKNRNEVKSKIKELMFSEGKEKQNFKLYRDGIKQII